MTAYYNEIDPYAAQWLRNLIAGGHIAPGEVDERSIEDVTPNDLRGFTQHHFFAGIGVWSYALRQAGWPDDKPVWTGSCPCQPFSAAGKGAGFDDERHLWPSFQWLIEECKPQHIFGEQVAAGNANAWFDLVQADLEGMGYAFGLTPFPASGIGAPHIRERAYWVAYADREYKSATGNQAGVTDRAGDGETDGMANTASDRWWWKWQATEVKDGWEERRFIRGELPSRSERCPLHSIQQATLQGSEFVSTIEVNGFWRDADWLLCRDGKWRPVESGTFPLVARFAKSLGHGKSSLRAMAGRNRTGRLKGYGNAINAEAAKAFIQAYMECEPC